MRALLALALVASVGFAADPHKDSATVDTKAWIIAPVKIVGDAALNFGKIIREDYNTPAAVTFKTTTAPNGGTTITSKDYVKCAQWKYSEAPNGAEFHVSFDVQADTGNKGVGFNISATPLIGGHGPACTLEPLSDLPAVDCALGSIDGQVEIANYVSFKHFGVGGKLNIPAGALGKKAGSLTVEAYYI